MAKQILLQTFGITIVLVTSFLSTKTQSQLFENCINVDPTHAHKSLNNINNALTRLTSMASTTHFYTYTSGSTSGHDQIYILFFCRYDASHEDCHTCVAELAASIVELCPDSLDTILYEDSIDCALHYANYSIFTYIEGPQFSESRIELVDDNDQFLQVLFSTVNSLIDNATSGYNISSRYFGTTVAPYLSSSHKMNYGLAQCNPDIKPSDCNNCLQNAFNNYNRYPGSIPVSGQMFLPICILGYKLSSKVQNSPWDFLSTGTRGTSLYGSNMGSILIVLLLLMLLLE